MRPSALLLAVTLLQAVSAVPSSAATSSDLVTGDGSKINTTPVITLNDLFTAIPGGRQAFSEVLSSSNGVGNQRQDVSSTGNSPAETIDNLLSILHPILGPIMGIIRQPCQKIYESCKADAAKCLEGNRPPLICDGYDDTCEDFKRAICQGKISLQMLPDFPIIDLKKQCVWLLGRICKNDDECKQKFKGVCGVLPGDLFPGLNPPNHGGNGGLLDGILGKYGLLGGLFGKKGAVDGKGQGN
ncbi:hypothetical protein BZA77DRAFT_289456 [Pyronema omphalodes]|nr:hypothetical protein BZA77DRAFT_289456 [Pyronema omphalodes]